MDWILYPVAALFSVLGLACVILVMIGLPGTWIMLALAFVVELVDRFWLSGQAQGSQHTFGWWLLGGSVLLAGIGEVVETLTGAAGTKVGGGSKRGMVGAVIGGILGAILFTPLIPIPLIGTLIGALLGTFAGALLAERSRSDRPDPSLGKDLKAATGATVGRLIGTMIKAMIAAALWITLSVAAVWRGFYL